MLPSAATSQPVVSPTATCWIASPGPNRIWVAVRNTPVTFTTAQAVLPDTTPPVISPPSAEVTRSGATIVWITDEAATSRVEYGLTPECLETTARDPALTTCHCVGLTGLEAGQTYHYRVISTDAAGNESVSASDVFTAAKPRSMMPGWVPLGLALIGGLGTATYFVGRKITGDPS